MSAPGEPDLVFVHLSDIHFRTGQMGDAHDVDQDIRNELERDLRTVRGQLVPRVDGMIVSGDIAFSGKADEFVFAGSWLERVREQIECPLTGVMVAPGNHDVDRDVIKAHAGIGDMHAALRASATLGLRDEELAKFLRESATGDLLLSPIGAYNTFAANYGCAVSRDKPFWERDFPLGNTEKLRIRGVSSTLISGPLDNDKSHKLVYGGAQRVLMREDGIWRVIVGHHPPSWMLDGEEAERTFSRRAALQLFGHKHDQWIESPDNSFRLIAGALHPDRKEDNWDPRYSVIAIRRQADGKLHLRVYPRKWSKEEEMFIGDFNSRGENYRERTCDADV